MRELWIGHGEEGNSPYVKETIVAATRQEGGYGAVRDLVVTDLLQDALGD